MVPALYLYGRVGQFQHGRPQPSHIAVADVRFSVCFHILFPLSFYSVPGTALGALESSFYSRNRLAAPVIFVLFQEPLHKPCNLNSIILGERFLCAKAPDIFSDCKKWQKFSLFCHLFAFWDLLHLHNGLLCKASIRSILVPEVSEKCHWFYLPAIYILQYYRNHPTSLGIQVLLCPVYPFFSSFAICISQNFEISLKG